MRGLILNIVRALAPTLLPGLLFAHELGDDPEYYAAVSWSACALSTQDPVLHREYTAAAAGFMVNNRRLDPHKVAWAAVSAIDEHPGWNEFCEREHTKHIVYIGSWCVELFGPNGCY